MLNAIRYGKAGSIAIGTGQTTSWRSLYQLREDLLMATVLERLTYLPTSVAWDLLRDSSVSARSIPESLGDLREVMYWPAFASPLKGTGYVEPDAVLFFERGAVIIEAKLYDQPMQSAWQWADEWAAFQVEFAAESGEEREHKLDEVFLLALGGVERKDTAGVASLESAAQQILLENSLKSYPEIRAMACRWIDLAVSVHNRLKKGHLSLDCSNLIRLLEDLEASFEMHGYRLGQWLESLPSVRSVLPVVVTLEDLEVLWQAVPAESTLDWSAMARLLPVELSYSQLRRLLNGR